MFDVSLAPLILQKDHDLFKQFDTSINMNIDSMVYPTCDGKKMVKEYDYVPGTEVGFAPHNVSSTMKLKVVTCRDNSGQFTWKKMMSTISDVLDTQMKGQIDGVSQIFVTLSFQEFFTSREVQADGHTYKRKFTPPRVVDMRRVIWTLKKFQLCYGGMLTMILPECHTNQATWSENDTD